RTTGCISDSTTFVIEDERYFPEIEVIVDPSNCQNPSGAANVVLSDISREFKVSWYGDNGFFAQEKELVYIPVGKYRVDVEGTDGCVASAEAEIKGDIIIYNGVSANYDGLNDFFQVVCLEYFPDNNVKIYNRAGLLVYEQDFYDMNDPGKRFEGESNKGASIIGTELPIGTYFYVVDKSDGSKAKVGYLELNR
ncbi:MAG: gliding motility-associated C-terminal domain-containing protein, partial [Spirochaetales bacterium]|nr:gliding motility-associated C-terminal domain-containing protein [Spirochaetales bacterium]